MNAHYITVRPGSSVRLLTAGKYCDRDIVITVEDLPADAGTHFDVITSGHGLPTPSIPTLWQLIMGDDIFIKAADDIYTANALVGRTAAVTQGNTQVAQKVLTASDLSEDATGIIISINGMVIGCVFFEKSVGTTLGNGVTVESAGTYLLAGTMSGVPVRTEINIPGSLTVEELSTTSELDNAILDTMILE